MRDVLALCSTSTPPEYLSYLKDRRIGTIVAGDDHIDMRVALESLNRKYGVKVMRVDSGGTLNSVFLHAGLVDEVSVLIHPFIAGGKADPTMSDPLKAGIPELQVPLRLQSTEVLGDGIVWARYAVQGRTGT
jgi:2,5-diamino-6-(ribosylamino)-4(3H)-pyrimidinone 5'-phosphate reductase